MRAKVITSGHGGWKYVDVVSAQAGKLESLEHVRGELGFALEATVACGDSGNDILMMSGRNRALVVGNAQPDLLQWVQSGGNRVRAAAPAQPCGAGAAQGERSSSPLRLTRRRLAPSRRMRRRAGRGCTWRRRATRSGSWRGSRTGALRDVCCGISKQQEEHDHARSGQPAGRAPGLLDGALAGRGTSAERRSIIAMAGFGRRCGGCRTCLRGSSALTCPAALRAAAASLSLPAAPPPPSSHLFAASELCYYLFRPPHQMHRRKPPPCVDPRRQAVQPVNLPLLLRCYFVLSPHPPPPPPPRPGEFPPSHHHHLDHSTVLSRLPETLLAIRKEMHIGSWPPFCVQNQLPCRFPKRLHAHAG